MDTRRYYYGKGTPVRENDDRYKMGRGGRGSRGGEIERVQAYRRGIQDEVHCYRP